MSLMGVVDIYPMPVLIGLSLCTWAVVTMGVVLGMDRTENGSVPDRSAAQMRLASRRLLLSFDLRRRDPPSG